VLQNPLAIATLHAAVRRVLGSRHDPAHADSMVWDDARALNALGGNAAAMQAMRGLFVAELPAQSNAVLQAIAAGDEEAVRAELHRLKASCGFVGSLRLLDAVRALSDAPDDPRRAEQFQIEVAAALAAAQPRH
jgi:HPt (histidine-containing phosphotransfer) domain-containing protein